MNIQLYVLTRAIRALYLFLISAFSCAQATPYIANLYAPITTIQSRRQAPNQYRFRDHCAYQYVRGGMRQAQQQSAISHQNYSAAPKATVQIISPPPSTHSNSTSKTVAAAPDPLSSKPPRTPPIQAALKHASSGTNLQSAPAISASQRQELTSARQLLAQKQQVPAISSYFQQEREHADRQLSQALDKVLAGNNSITQEHYSLDLQTEQLLQKNNIAVEDFTHCTGNAATLQKHREIIVLINKIADLRDRSPANKSFEEILYHFLDAASLSNKEGQLFASCRITDFSWTGLDYLYCAVQGFTTGGLNIFYALSDPAGTGAHIIEAGLELGRFLGHFCAEMVAYQAHMSYQEICTLNNLKPDRELTDLKALKSRLLATQSLGTILDQALKDFAKKSGPQRVGMLTEMGAEYFLTGPVAHRIARGARLLWQCSKTSKKCHACHQKGQTV